VNSKAIKIYENANGQINAFSRSTVQSAPAAAERTVTGLHASLVRSIRSWISFDGPVLDIGCGSGAWLKRLSDEGFTDLMGVDIDISQVAVNVGEFRQVGIDRCGSWSLPQKPYRLISAIEVIEHLANVGHLLCQVAKILSPDGYFLLTSPNIHSLACRLRFLVTGSLKQFGTIGDPTHFFPVILETFPRVLANYNLDIVHLWGYPEDGLTLTSRKPVNLVTAFLRRFLSETVPGDTLCMLIQKSKP
jgi:2-polyprenyl-3-methyl-5-hydroxy-6-metoxy-1,4-benzoquinol methylase